MPIDIRPKQTGLAAKLAQAKANSASMSTVVEGAELKAPEAKPITYLAVTDPTIKDKLGIVFDDSGSMGVIPIKEAKDGVIDFLRNCIPNQTAVALYPMNSRAYKLSTDLPSIANAVLDIKATDCTPLVATAQKMLNMNPALTRGIVFSDGSPDVSDTTALVSNCTERKLSLDTVFIGSEANERAIAFMRKLAEDTGGTFIHLKPGVSMRNTFKYLAPAYRGLLADKSFLNKVEKGEV